MPAWLIDVLSKSPLFAVLGTVAYYGYKVLTKSSPSLFVATIVSVLGTKQMRDDALRTVEVLADVKDDQPAIEAPPGQPPRTGRRPRHRRRR